MYKVVQCGKNDFKLLFNFARKRGKFCTGFRNVTCLVSCEKTYQRLLPIFRSRGVTFIADTYVSKCSEELLKLNVPVLLLSSGVALLLAFSSERPNGRFDTYGGGNSFGCYLHLTYADVC
jgi:hypothetical protein